MRTEYLAALEAASGKPASAEALTRLAARFGEEPARWAYVQIGLRKRASIKFRDADQMLFDIDGIQMATHEAIASYHASRFPASLTVNDVTCGLGSDLRAFGRRGPAIGYDVDADRLKLARWNCRGLPVEFVHGDAFSATLSSGFAFADPSRRSDGHKIHIPSDYEPNPMLLAERFRELDLAAIKLSPMLPDMYLKGLGMGVEFVSHGRECREALVWFGRLAKPGCWAVLASTGERLPCGPSPETIGEPNMYLMEADPAAIRAHALAGFGLDGLGDSNGYFTSTKPVESSWLKAYRVLYTGPADPKKTKAALRELDASTPEIKVRGAHIDAKRLARDLASSGRRAVSVAVWPVGRRLKHTIIEAVAALR